MRIGRELATSVLVSSQFIRFFQHAMGILLPPRSEQGGFNLDRVAIGSTRGERLESRTQCTSFSFKERVSMRFFA
jgi:hypothetical protein